MSHKNNCMLILRKEMQLIILCLKCSAVTVKFNFISCTEARVHSEFLTSGQEMDNDELYSDPLCSSKGFKAYILSWPNHSSLSVS